MGKKIDENHKERPCTSEELKLVNSCLPLAYKLANRANKRYGLGEDAHGEAMYALLLAAQRFIPSRCQSKIEKLKFFLFARKCIVNRIRRVYRGRCKLSGGYTNSKRAAPASSRCQTKVVSIQLDLNKDSQHRGYGGEEKNVPYTYDEDFAEVDEVKQLLKTLDQRSQEIIRRWVWGDETYQQIADSLGLTRERIRQILDHAFEKLRRLINRHKPEKPEPRKKKLGAEKIAQILERYVPQSKTSGSTPLAIEFGVSRSTILNLVREQRGQSS